MHQFGTSEYWKERYEDERARAAADAEREHQKRERQRKEREAGREARHQQDLRTADNWPSALRKQRSLMSAMQEDIEADCQRWGGEPDSYFADGAAACRRAEDFLAAELALRRDEDERLRLKIADLEQQRRQLRADAARSAADSLEEEAGGRKGWQSVAKALRTIKETERELSDWLTW